MAYTMNRADRRRQALAALGAAAALGAGAARAAPLDTLLSAYPADQATVQAEVAADGISTAWVSDRPSSRTTTYRGGHVRVGGRPAERLWLEGALWQRSLEHRSVDGSLQSWQAAAQWRLLGSQAAGGALALRASLWGNQAGSLSRTQPLRLGGQVVEGATIHDPRDRNAQLDLIGTLGTARNGVTLFAGVQRTQVDFDGLSGRATSAAGCRYAVQVDHDSALLEQTAPCRTGPGRVLLASSARLSSEDMGLSPGQALAYHAAVARVGASAVGSLGNWRLRGGLTYEAHDRSAGLEAATAAAGATPVTRFASAALELSYAIVPQARAFVRATAFSAVLASEVPFVYNALTARSIEKPAGYLSVGAIVQF